MRVMEGHVSSARPEYGPPVTALARLPCLHLARRPLAGPRAIPDTPKLPWSITGNNEPIITDHRPSGHPQRDIA